MANEVELEPPQEISRRDAEPAEQLGSTDSWAHDAWPLCRTHHAQLSVGEGQEATPSVVIGVHPWPKGNFFTRPRLRTTADP